MTTLKAATAEVTRLTSELERAERERDMYRSRLAEHRRWQSRGPVRALAMPVFVAALSTAVFVGGIVVSALTHADLMHQNPSGITMIIAGAIGLGWAMFNVDDVVTHRAAARSGVPTTTRSLEEVGEEIDKLTAQLSDAAAEKDRAEKLPAAIPVIERLIAGAERTDFDNADAAKLHGIIHGWRGTGGEDLLARLAPQHSWTPEDVIELRNLHEAWIVARQQEADRRA